MTTMSTVKGTKELLARALVRYQVLPARSVSFAEATAVTPQKDRSDNVGSEMRKSPEDEVRAAVLVLICVALPLDYQTYRVLVHLPADVCSWVDTGEPEFTSAESLLHQLPWRSFLRRSIPTQSGILARVIKRSMDLIL